MIGLSDSVGRSLTTLNVGANGQAGFGIDVYWVWIVFKAFHTHGK